MIIHLKWRSGAVTKVQFDGPVDLPRLYYYGSMHNEVFERVGDTHEYREVRIPTLSLIYVVETVWPQRPSGVR